MLLAMEAGMLLFHVLVGGVLKPLGFEAALASGTDLYRIAHAVFMAAPIVAWMRVRGHGWRLGTEAAVAYASQDLEQT